MHRRDGVSWARGDFGTGHPETILRINHGSVPLVVRDIGKCIVVLGVIDVPEEVDRWLAGVPPAGRDEFLGDLREVLMSCPRIGFSVEPSETSGDAMPRRIALDQTLQVAENDAASFNRFCDAIQETETVLLRVSERLRAALAHANDRPVYSSSLPPPRDLYL